MSDISKSIIIIIRNNEGTGEWFDSENGLYTVLQEKSIFRNLHRKLEIIAETEAVNILAEKNFLNEKVLLARAYICI